jgi:hypothetical protein
MNRVKISKLLMCGLAMAILTTAGAFAGTVNITWPTPHAADGVFILTPSGDGDLGTTAFQTFCLETNEYIYIGGTYNYTLSDSAMGGGSGGPRPDPISLGTAYLYSQFRAGTLQGYNGSVEAQNALQTAFWFLEGETMASGLTYDPKFVNIALNALGLTLEQLKADANGAFGVGVANLWNADGSGAQSMLALVPDGGLTAMLLGLGIGGLALFSRKLKQ